MNTRARIARRLAAILIAATLVAALAVAWTLRPALLPFPHSLSAPLPPRAISGTLDLAAWIVFVLLDLVLLAKLIRLTIQGTAGRNEHRLRHAFAAREKPVVDGRDWRMHAAALTPPVLRLPPRRGELEPESTGRERLAWPEEPTQDLIASADRRESLGIRLLGSLELTGCKKKQPRRQATSELIAYLAIQRRPVSRDELLEMLWPGDDPRRSAARFYQAASEARKLFGDAFRRSRDNYALDRDRLRIDVDELDQLRKDAEVTAGDEQRTLLEQALALFRGQLLQGMDALWVASEQRRLTALRADLLVRAGRLRLESGDAADALAFAEEAAALDASNEQPVQLAIEAEAVLGRRDAVVERYERLRHDLDGRFGLEPSRETKVLYRRLLAQDSAIVP